MEFKLPIQLSLQVFPICQHLDSLRGLGILNHTVIKKSLSLLLDVSHPFPKAYGSLGALEQKVKIFISSSFGLVTLFPPLAEAETSP